MYGDDPDAPLPDPDNEGVMLPRVDLNLDEESLAALNDNFDPTQNDGNYGIDIYLQVREYLNRVLQQRRQ